MRLVIVLDRLNIGGAERHACTLAIALRARGHEVILVILFDGGALLPPSGLPVWRLGGAGRLRGGRVRQLRAALRDIAPDMVLSVNQTASVLTHAARVGLGLPHDIIFHTTMLPTRLAHVKVQAFKVTTRFSRNLIFVSDMQRDHWAVRGLHGKADVVIRNGVDLSRFRPDTAVARDGARARLGLAPDDIAVFLVGRLAVEKNHAGAFSALAAAGAKAPQLRLVCVGEGPLEATLRAQVAAMGLSGHVVFTGAAPDITDLLPAADFGILPSQAVETLSLAALEMMACGLPMLLSDIGGARELVIDGETGFIFPPQDVAGFADGMLRLTDATLRQRLGQAARLHVAGQFTEAAMVTAYEALWCGDGAKVPRRAAHAQPV